MNLKWILFGAIMAALLVSGCQADEPTATTSSGETVTRGEARVESIEIMILESFPVQVHVVAKGNLPDGCTTIDRVIQMREGDTFEVTITTRREADALCTEALVPFEEAIRLDVLGLNAGTYTVDVNGVRDSFELAVDNVPPTPSSPLEPRQPDSPLEPDAGAVITDEANVESVEILILESFPVQVAVVAQGVLSDSCTEIDRVLQQREGSEFTVTITTRRPADAVCAQVLAPFEERVELDVQGLESDVYTVSVNGIKDSFELSVDN